MKNFIFSLLLIISFSASSQSPWDLQTCISYALNHNISLRQSSLNNELYKNNTEQSKGALLPSLNAGATHVYNFGKTIDRFTNEFADKRVLSQNFYLGSSVILWGGLSQVNIVKANEYTYLSGVELLKQQKNDVSLNVANAYIGVIFSEEVLKISQNQYSVTAEQLERTSKLVTAGALAKSVEYDIKAQLANELVNVTVAGNNFQISILTLKQLMNLDSVTNFSIARPEITLQEAELLENNVQFIYESSLKTQAIIKSNEYSILSAERSLRSAKGRISPSLSLNGNLATGYSGLALRKTGDYQAINTIGTFTYSSTMGIYEKAPFVYQFQQNIAKSLGLTLNIPLYNGLQTHTAIKNAKINALNTRLSLDLTKQNLYKNIAQAHVNAKAGLNKYMASKFSVEAATESFNYAQQKFNAGVISAIDFSTSKNRLYAAESNLLQAKYDYVFKLKVLDYYQGKPLGF